VSHAASLAAHFVQRGYTVRLLTRTETVPAGAGQAHLTRILRTLALLRFTTLDQRLPASPFPGESIHVSAGGTSHRVPQGA